MSTADVSPETIARRRAARHVAAELAELVIAELANVPEEARATCVAELRRRLPQLQAAPAPACDVEPFNDAQAAAWGRNRMQFGKHAGTPIDEVPVEYLRMIAEPNDFTRHLRRYLASRRIQAEEREPDEE